MKNATPMLNLVLIGLNHRTAALDTRERAAFEAARIPEALQTLSKRPSVEEAMIFSTCNRVELLARVSETPPGLASMEEFLRETSRLLQDELDGKLYRYTEEAAVRHLFRVAASLDSLILGEPQILGQVKDFYGIALRAGTVGNHLNSLVQAALHAAKRVRSETSIGEYSVSVSSAAVELARKIFGRLEGKQILIVGAGKMGELAVRHLKRSGADRVWVSNRSPEAARSLAAAFAGDAVPYGDLPRWIARSDVVVTSTGSKEQLVDLELARRILSERNGAPIVFIDISVPRNVDPAVGTLDGAFYYDVDDLGSVVEANLQERRKESSLAERIVEAEVANFCQRARGLEVAPVVKELEGRIREICGTELERYLRRAGPLSAHEREELELLVSRIAGKIAHPLITHARASPHDPERQSAYLDMIRRIFKLEKSTES